MTTTTAKLAAAKLTDQNGIDEDAAAKMFTHLGSKRMAIVELQVSERTEGATDSHVVKLAVIHLELVPDGKPADTARDWAKAIYKARQPAPLDPEFGEETADQVADRAQALIDDGHLVEA